MKFSPNLQKIRIRNLLITLVSVICTFITLLHNINESYLGNDFVDFVVPLQSLNSGMHNLYGTFWEIHPPLLFLTLFAWISIFGKTLVGFYILFSLTLFSFYSLMILIICDVTKSNKGFLVGTFFCLVVAFQNFFGIFFPIEIIGTTLTLFSVYLIFKKQSMFNIFICFFLITYAGFIKEVYLVPSIFILAALIILNPKRKLKVIIAAASGLCSSTILTLVFLLYANSWNDYLTVMKYKDQTFNYSLNSKLLEQIQLLPYFVVKNYSIFGILPLNLIKLLILFALTLAIFIGLLNFRKLNLNEINKLILKNAKIFILSATLCGLYFGMVLQGKPLNGHYAISFMPFTYILYGKLIAHFTRKFNENRSNIMVVGSSVMIMFALMCPNLDQTFRVANKVFINLGNLSSHIRDMESTDSTKAYRISTPSNNPCIQVAYGWGSGSFYHYSNAYPCSKFFLIELIARNRLFTDMFVKEILARPPNYIVYDTRLADLDVLLFEKEVFPYRKILANCYELDNLEKYLYRSKSNEIQLKSCIITTLIHAKIDY